MKTMVYTAITGDYDTLKEIKYIDKEIDYYCFTNNPKIKSKTWKIMSLDNPELLDFIRLERKIKILGCEEIFKNYDLAVYMDANIELRNQLVSLLKKNVTLKITTFFLLSIPIEIVFMKRQKYVLIGKKTIKRLLRKK